MLSATTRVVVAVVAVLVLLGGMAMLTIGPAGISGLWLVISAAVVLVALAIERNRYRSEEAERSFEATGPGSIRETWMRAGAISRRSTSVSPSTANLVAL